MKEQVFHLLVEMGVKYTHRSTSVGSTFIYINDLSEFRRVVRLITSILNSNPKIRIVENEDRVTYVDLPTIITIKYENYGP